MSDIDLLASIDEKLDRRKSKRRKTNKKQRKTRRHQKSKKQRKTRRHRKSRKQRKTGQRNILHGGNKKPSNVSKKEWEMAQLAQKRALEAQYMEQSDVKAQLEVDLKKEQKEQKRMDRIKNFIAICNETDKLLCNPDLFEIIENKIKDMAQSDLIKRCLLTIDNHIESMRSEIRCSTKIAVSLLSERLWRTYTEIQKYIDEIRGKLDSLNQTVQFRESNLAIYTNFDDFKRTIAILLQNN